MSERLEIGHNKALYFTLPVCEADSRATVVAADEKQSNNDGEEQHRHHHVPDY